MRFKTIPLVALALCGAIAAPAALAQSTGDWTVALGAHQVNPDSDNGKLAAGTLPLDIGSSTRPTIAVEYFVRDNLGLEVLAALPFRTTSPSAAWAGVAAPSTCRRRSACSTTSTARQGLAAAGWA